MISPSRRLLQTMPAVLAGFMHLPALAGQEVVRIVGDQTYCDCQITAEHVVTLGDTAGPGMLLGEIRQVRRNTQGIYHVLAWNEHQIYRFTPDGRALSRLGHEGRGPGEALRITSFSIVADSVVTFDSRNARMTVFDPSGDVSRTMSIPGNVPDAAYFPNVGVVVNARGSDAASFGIPLHLLDMSGERVRSFGGEGMIRIDAGLMLDSPASENSWCGLVGPRELVRS